MQMAQEIAFELKMSVPQVFMYAVARPEVLKSWYVRRDERLQLERSETQERSRLARIAEVEQIKADAAGAKTRARLGAQEQERMKPHMQAQARRWDDWDKTIVASHNELSDIINNRPPGGEARLLLGPAIALCAKLGAMIEEYSPETYDRTGQEPPTIEALHPSPAQLKRQLDQLR